MDDAAPLTLLARALDEAGRVIAGTRPDQAGLPTPCASWTVEQVAGHLVTDLDNFATAVRGGKPDWSRRPQPLGDDWSAVFAQGRSGLEAAWAAATAGAPAPAEGASEAPVLSRADQQVTEVAIHAWDIARGTGQGVELDEAVAEYALRWGMANLRAEYRGPEEAGTGFGPEVPVAAGAPATDRLAGWFGRDPSWVTPGR